MSRGACLKAFDVAAEAVVALMLLFALGAYGAVQAWSIAILQIAVGLLLALWIVRGSVAGRLSFPRTGALLPVAAFVVLVLVQLIPLPFSVARPRALTSLFPTVALQPRRLGTVYAWQSVRSLFFFCTFAALFIATAEGYRTRAQLSRLGAWIAALGLVACACAIVTHTTAPSESGRLSGTFVNPNHFAAFLLMTGLLSLGLTLGYLERGASLLAVLYYGACATAALVGIVGSGSRGALAALALGTLVLAALLLASHCPRRRWWLGGSALLVAAGIAACSFSGPLARRLSTAGATAGELSLAARQQVWAAAVPMFTASPTLGYGLGSFQYVFPRYQSFHPELFYSHAHNEYWQVALETGVVGLGLLLCGGLRVFGRALRAAMKRRSPRALGGIFGGLAALVAVLAHSFVDFPLRLGANAALFAVILAFVLVLSHTTSRSRGHRFLREWRLELRGPSRMLAPIGAAVGVILCAHFALAPWRADRAATAAVTLADSDARNAARHMLAAVGRDPGNAALHARCADLLSRDNDTTGRSLDPALAQARRAVALCPTVAAYHQKLGWLYGRRAAWTPGDYADLGLTHMQAAIACQPGNAYRHRALARWALNFAKAAGQSGVAVVRVSSHGPNPAKRNAYAELALREYARAALLDPTVSDELCDLLQHHTRSWQEAVSLLPEDPRLYYQYAAWLKRRQRDAEADTLFARTAELLRRRLEQNPSSAQDHFTLALCILYGLKDPGQAAEAFRDAIRLDPRNATFHHWYARMLVNTGQYEQAVVQELRATRLNPALAEPFYWLGRAYRALGKSAEAVRAFRRACELDPAEPAYQLNLKQLLSARAL